MRDKWDLAYERCRAVMAFLVEQGVDPARVHFRVAAENEPAYENAEGGRLERNSRAEILLWDDSLGE
jgi:flagellar motor protein MotB